MNEKIAIDMKRGEFVTFKEESGHSGTYELKIDAKNYNIPENNSGVCFELDGMPSIYHCSMFEDPDPE